MRLDEVQVFVPVVVLLLQRADGIALVSHGGVGKHTFTYHFTILIQSNLCTSSYVFVHVPFFQTIVRTAT